MGCKSILVVSLLFTLTISNAQKYTLSGFITDSASRELIIAVNVYIPELKTGTSTNNYGFYSITLPAGKHEVHYSYVGYNGVVQQVDLNKNIRIDISLNSNILLKEVVISSGEFKKISETPRMSTITIPVTQIKSIPALLGEKDVLKVIQLMPGVQKGKEGTSGLYIRGGAIDQNLIILDDATVYNAFHLFGFFSLFNGDAIKSVELIKGGFPARYGGRLSSVIEMTMKDGNKLKYSGEGSVGIISSKLLVEGPIKKNKSSFLISARRTYIDLLLYPLLPKEAKFGYYFYDLNAKLNFELDPKNHLYFSGYFGRDKFYIGSKITDLNNRGGFFWQNQTATCRWNHLINDKLFSNLSLIYSNYKLQIYDYENDPGGYYNAKYFSGIMDASIKYDLEYHPWASHTIRFGLLSTYHLFRPSAFVLKSSDENFSNIRKINTVENGVYAEDEFTFNDKIKMNAGIRLSNFIAEKMIVFHPEPRISFSYLLTHDLAIKASYAVMNQYLHLLTTTGLGLPTDLWVPSTNRVPSQHNQQFAAGLAKDVPDYNFTISLEGYYKISKDVLEYKEGASFLTIDDPTSSENITWEDNVTTGKGHSYGAELLIQRNFGRLSGWIGYTLSWTKMQFDEINSGKEFYADYDRRNDISIVAVYEINDHVTFSATWVYGTGNWITLPLADYKQPDIPLHFNSSYYPQTVTDYGDRNNFRMLSYHRLDVGFQFHKKFKNSKAEWIWELSIYNVYNRKNPYFYYEAYNGNQAALKQISIFPFLPSVSLSIKF